MKKYLLALFIGLVSASALWAAGETSVQWGLSPGANPRSLCVFDVSSARPCDLVGTVDATAHLFNMGVGQGGTGAATGLNARLNLGITGNTNHGDSDYSIGATDGPFISLSAAITSPRTWTLPLANSVKAGDSKTLFVGTLTAPNTITVAVQGGNTLANDGVLGSVSLTGAYIVTFVSNGSTFWNVLSNPSPFDAVSASKNNIYTGKQMFASSDPWWDVQAFGCVGNFTPSATDTSCFQDTINAAQAFPGGGTVYVSGGAYCVTHGPITSNGSSGFGLHITGTSVFANHIGTCGTDNTILSFSGRRGLLENIFLEGKDSGTFGSTTPTLIVGTSGGCLECLIQNIYIVGGKYGIENHAFDMIYYNNFVSDTFGSAMVYNLGGNIWLRNKFDQIWPVVVPSNGLVITVRTDTTAYLSGDVVSFGGYNWQCSVAGTTGTGTPTLQNYEVPVVDGTARWLLVGPTTYYALQDDTGASENQFEMGDLSGPFTAGIAQTNTLAGSPPSFLKIIDSTVSQNISHGIYIASGSFLWAEGLTVGVLSATGDGVTLNGGGDATIANSLLLGGANGVNVVSGVGYTITSNRFYALTTAVNIGANRGSTAVNNNVMGVSLGAPYTAPTNSVVCAAGTGSDIKIMGNIMAGLVPNCLATGARNVISNN